MSNRKPESHVNTRGDCPTCGRIQYSVCECPPTVACEQTEPLPMAPMINPAFAPGQWPPHVKTCCECGAEIKNETYVVRQSRVYCQGCAATVED